jgi:hypothetical protein
MATVQSAVGPGGKSYPPENEVVSSATIAVAWQCAATTAESISRRTGNVEAPIASVECLHEWVVHGEADIRVDCIEGVQRRVAVKVRGCWV